MLGKVWELVAVSSLRQSDIQRPVSKGLPLPDAGNDGEALPAGGPPRPCTERAPRARPRASRGELAVVVSGSDVQAGTRLRRVYTASGGSEATAATRPV